MIKQRLLALLICLILVSFSTCRQNRETSVSCIAVKKGSFAITIPAFGELKSTKATPIMVPAQIRGRQTISWMMPENSMVKKGQVVTRLDSTWYVERIQREKYSIAKLNLEIQKKGKELEKKKSEFKGQQNVTELEKKMTEDFQVTDESIFSRNEIIDFKNNSAYLEKKSKYYKQQQKKLDQQARTELQLLQLKIKSHRVKLQQYEEALNSMEIKAPHDGLFIYEKNWRGEKPNVGMAVYGGRKLGKLPDLSQMEAKLFILESEASGLKSELPLSIHLDSFPSRLFTGKIKRIDNIAKAIERDSPLKYFETIAILNKTDPKIMKPGSQVMATIYVEKKENIITVPNQALFFKDEKASVYIQTGSSFKEREVKIGARSLTRTIVTAGLEEGEVVALGKPRQENNGQ